MDVDVYCDECRQDLLVNKNVINENNKYTVLGGIWIPKKYRNEFKNKVKKLCSKHLVFGEIKWKRVSNSKLAFYKELIDLFFNYKNINFRAIVIDASVFNIGEYHNGSSELGFYKCYYQLLRNWINKNNKYNIFLDYRKDKSKTRAYDLKKCINSSLKNSSVENIQFINSKESLLLQLEDVIMGCISYKYNFGYTGLSIAKKELLNTFEKHCIINETSSINKKVNIFKIRLRGGNDE